MYQLSSSSLKVTMILISSIFSMNFSRNNQNAATLKIIKISRNCHGRLTANYSKFLASHSIHSEMWYNFTPTFLKIWKIWAYAFFYPIYLYLFRLSFLSWNWHYVHSLPAHLEIGETRVHTILAKFETGRISTVPTSPQALQ